MPEVAPAILTDINASMLSVGRDRAISRGYVSEPFVLRRRCRAESRFQIAALIASPSLSAFATAPTRQPSCAKPAACSVRAGVSSVSNSSRVQVAALAPIYDTWSFKVLPKMGAMVAGDRESYQYLAESISHVSRSGNSGPDVP
jgi:demethylmenaquinone methyltransferase/2-methoxy-6-polyprenyl-1,4-benzoquinol methylase